ncbi:MAG: MBL fold metallo-hydrolase [Candidatus Woesearchaeota archaeon]|nr:MAG: MBL fold metallo-hydrolase [Candidatus Woesearchaeota archaeon]
MKIKKLGHCCMQIDHKGKRILTDPGAYAEGYEDVKDVDIILITHEHGDHLHTSSLELVKKNNPNAIIVTNNGVGIILSEMKVDFKILTDGNSEVFNELLFEAFGTQHEEIYKEIGQVENTGYFIDNYLFYPGDAFTVIDKPVPLLALPVEGPWMKISEAIEYALAQKPKVCFPVHDGRLRPDRIGANHKVPSVVLPKHGIEFVKLLEMEEHDFGD